ncbi:MAG: hypothetical protein LBE83_00090 [Propionibacteriaceae bacterium]|jgi:hypothetical protein|nr:hypothetical protein [Propionibacteriaceae bacterium]
MTVAGGTAAWIRMWVALTARGPRVTVTVNGRALLGSLAGRPMSGV